MITADPQLEDVKVALKVGAYDFVGKPLDLKRSRLIAERVTRTFLSAKSRSEK